MNEKESNTYKEYKFSRDNIQLINAHVVQITLNKKVDTWEEECINNLQAAIKLEVVDFENILAYLKVNVKVKGKKNRRVMGDILVVCKGYFIGNPEIDNDDLERLVKLQAFPQLLPYIRSAIANLSTMMEVPTIVLPTIDIIKTIQVNSDLEE
ncbi:protein-export chaperone SecB [Pelosinus propionicus]|uniref:Preprotein translocase subunit SecB n=1 Tax=Pelosinus propionicus DSM 13327 TaxID=1123291 RepID=A0A1I4QGQ6_9FIRM|nr:protein-export chaperone SecB [Pelosinus propionicus]SFM39197.1 Preprotein translocase subunit SecB [Pelosinus propionicus DSM 13327]